VKQKYHTRSNSHPRHHPGINFDREAKNMKPNSQGFPILSGKMIRIPFALFVPTCALLALSFARGSARK